MGKPTCVAGTIGTSCPAIFNILTCNDDTAGVNATRVSFSSSPESFCSSSWNRIFRCLAIKRYENLIGNYSVRSSFKKYHVIYNTCILVIPPLTRWSSLHGLSLLQRG